MFTKRPIDRTGRLNRPPYVFKNGPGPLKTNAQYARIAQCAAE